MLGGQDPLIVTKDGIRPKPACNVEDSSLPLVKMRELSRRTGFDLNRSFDV